MANDHPFRIAIKLGEARGDVVHRNVERAWDRCDFKFFRLADIKYRESLAAIETFFDFGWFEVANSRHVSGLGSAEQHRFILVV
jgi:hypothetical protein